MAKTFIGRFGKPGGGISAIFLLIWIICLFFPVKSLAGGDLVKVQIPEALHAGLRHFFDLVDPEKAVTFDPEMVGRVLEFIEEPKEEGTLHFQDRILDLPSAYYEFDIHRDLHEIAEYSYNPDIPDIATMPSSAFNGAVG